MSVNQNDIDALLSSSGQIIESDTGEEYSVDDLVAQAMAEESAKSAAPVDSAKSETTVKPQPAPDTSALTAECAEEQARAAQKILFEVFSSIPDKKDRSRLLNWANDAFIKSKFF